MNQDAELMVLIFMFSLVLGVFAIISISLNKKRNMSQFKRKRNFKVIDGGKNGK